jgi:hypothetical protein
VPLAMEVCVPPPATATSQGRLPPVTVAIGAPGAACSGGAAVATAWGGAGLQAPRIACTVTALPAAAASNATGSGDVFVAGGTAIVDDVTGRAVFGGIVLTAAPGRRYTLTLACSIGALAVPPAASFPLELVGCAPGLQAAGVFCVQCVPGQYSFGGNASSATCASCPSRGVECANGLLALLPHYFRATRMDAPLTNATELWPCWNGEACLVFNATDAVTHACAPGYTGALCGVCDAAGGYAKFGDVCRPCWDPGASSAFLAIAVVVVVALLCYVSLRRSDGQRSEASIALKITLSFLQVRGRGVK